MIPMPDSEMVKIKTLQLAPYNPRSITEPEMKELMASLEQFGFVAPVIARRTDGLLIGGHQRIVAFQRILEKQGRNAAQIANTPIPAVLLDIDDHRAKLLNLALNKIQGNWDYDKLNDLFTELRTELPPELIALSGFDAREIADILLMNSGEQPTLGTEVVDVDAVLAGKARKFAFEVKTDDEAAICVKVLNLYGMTGPATAGTAFLAAMRAAGETFQPALKEAPEPEVPKATRTRRTAASRRSISPLP